MQPYSDYEPRARCAALRLAAALDAYAATCSRLVNSPPDMEIFACAGAAIAEIRDQGVIHPALTVLALQLAICHAELEAALWQRSASVIAETKLPQVLERHAAAVQALRVATTRMLPHDQPAAAPGTNGRA